MPFGPLADKRPARRQEADAALGPGAVARLTAAVPDQAARPAAPGQPADPVLLAERTVATVATHRSTWTVWSARVGQGRSRDR